MFQKRSCLYGADYRSAIWSSLAWDLQCTCVFWMQTNLLQLGSWNIVLFSKSTLNSVSYITPNVAHWLVFNVKFYQGGYSRFKICLIIHWSVVVRWVVIFVITPDISFLLFRWSPSTTPVVNGCWLPCLPLQTHHVSSPSRHCTNPRDCINVQLNVLKHYLSFTGLFNKDIVILVVIVFIVFCQCCFCIWPNCTM